MTDLADSSLLMVADTYLDRAPRPDSDVAETGAFSLFVSRTPWSYYARPARSHPQPVTVADIEVLAAACDEHGVRLEIEWVDEVHPELAEVAMSFGLTVNSYALMTLEADEPLLAPATDAMVRVVDAEDPALLAGWAVAGISFSAGGTAIGSWGTAERDIGSRDLPLEMVAHLRDRARRRLSVTAVAETVDGVVASGLYNPIDGTAEVLAVATLPVARRQGFAGAVTAGLVQHARENGVRLLLLSAESDDVARVYGRLGFRRIGTTCAAEQRAG